MMAIVETDAGVTLLGAGTTPPALLPDVLAMAPVLVAADGGAQTALEAGLRPRAVIGDFDSLSAETRAQLPPDCLHDLSSDQDSTDFEKALGHVAAPFVLGLGFLGARVDHELAALHVLRKFAHRRIFLLGGRDVICVAPPRIELDLPAETRVSLFPLEPMSGTSTGLRWPIDGIAMSPVRRVGTSNKALGGPVSLTMDRPGMLLILPVAQWQRLVAAHPGGWDAATQP